jgi:hypothetical protein
MDSKIYRILFETSRPQYRIQVIWKTYKETETVGFFFTKERLIIYGSVETILARLHLNFSYALNFEVTFKKREGREHWTVNSKDSHHDTTVRCS